MRYPAKKTINQENSNILSFLAGNRDFEIFKLDTS